MTSPANVSGDNRAPARTVVASAPGKIIVFGEYAVMAGAPAVVLAIDRYAHATARIALEDSLSGTTWRGTVHAPQVGVAAAEFSVSPHRAINWARPEDGEALGLISAVLRNAYHQLPHAMSGHHLDLDLDTAGFIDASGTKLGLGSSAAVTVAAAAAIASVTEVSQPTLAQLVALHRDFQGGRGSGFDIAAAITGGALVYHDRSQTTPPATAPLLGTFDRSDTAGPAATRVDLPADLAWRVVFTGRSGATAPLLARVAAWQQRQPREAADLFARMAAAATAGIENIGTAAGIINAAASYDELMKELGSRSDVDIVGADHSELANLAASCGVFYKGCGAGGGDVGIALATDSSRLDVFEEKVRRKGFVMPPLSLARTGLTVAQ